MTKLSWTGFSKKTPQERKEHLKKNALLSQENQDLLDKDQQLALETANQMAENVIGRFTLPFAICPDVLVDGRDLSGSHGYRGTLSCGCCFLC